MSNMLTLQEAAALKREILSSLHCALPGIVESFDAEEQTAAVRPAVKRRGTSLPVLRDVPVFFPGSRDSGITWPVSPGDECLLVFADLDIDRWFESGEAEEPDSARRHDLSDAFAFVGFRSRPNRLEGAAGRPSFFGIDPADADHLHDGRYYTEAEMDAKLAAKAASDHLHDGRYYTEAEVDAKLDGKAASDHLHDSRYYTEAETDTMLDGKADTGHKHSAADITSGTLALSRGGTGRTGTGSTAAIADIATAAADCEITAAQYAYWGKAAMVRLVVKKTTAVTSGTTTLCTLASGKRPKYAAPAQWVWNNGAVVNTSGTVQVNGAISAGASVTVLATYILA